MRLEAFPELEPATFNLSRELRNVAAVKCRRSLAEFVRRAWPIVEPGTPLTWNWHLDAICQHLQAVSEGRIRRLIINIPPGHAKSLIVSVFWPAWEWTIRPSARTIFGSYNQQLAFRDSSKCRDIVTSDWYRQTFDPDWRMKGDQNAKHLYGNTSTGVRQCIFVGGTSKTGWRGDKIVMDDPLAADQQFNRAAKDHAWFVWEEVLSSRVNDPATAAFVLIMQRLADDDLAGRLIERGREKPRLKYELLSLPSEFVPEKRTVTSIGWTDPRTEKGELLFPGKYTQDVLDDFKVTLGPNGYSAQFQQDPVPEGGSRFQRDWFRFWKRVDDDLILITRPGGQEELVRLSLCTWFATQDAAVSEKTQADFTVIAPWCVTPRHKELILMPGMVWDRLEDPAAVQAAVDLDEMQRGLGYALGYFVVEANGVGKPRAQNMRERGLAVVEVDVHADKVAMSATAVVRAYSGQIYIPPASEFPRVAEWLEEHVRFPFAKHDDTVTATSLAANQIFPSALVVNPTATTKVHPLTMEQRLMAATAGRPSADAAPHPTRRRGFGGRKR